MPFEEPLFPRLTRGDPRHPSFLTDRSTFVRRIRRGAILPGGGIIDSVLTGYVDDGDPTKVATAGPSVLVDGARTEFDGNGGSPIVRRGFCQFPAGGLGSGTIRILGFKRCDINSESDALIDWTRKVQVQFVTDANFDIDTVTFANQGSLTFTDPIDFVEVSGTDRSSFGNKAGMRNGASVAIILDVSEIPSVTIYGARFKWDDETNGLFGPDGVLFFESESGNFSGDALAENGMFIIQFGESPDG